MTRSEISVRVNDHVNDRNVTAYASGVKFRVTAPGGYAAASCTITLPYRTLPNLGPADELFIYESSSGDLLWRGNTDNPGALAGSRGESFELSAMGPMSRASDERRSLVYVDTDLQQWIRSAVASMPASATAEVREDPTAVVTTGGLVAQFPPGNPIATGNESALQYSFTATDMTFGALSASVKGGKTDAAYDVYLSSAGGSPGSEGSMLGANLSTSPVTAARWVGEGAGHPLEGRTRVALSLVRNGGATNIADDLTWVFFYNLSVVGRRMSRYGVPLSGAAALQSAAYVRGDWVVEDLLGRMLTFCDPARSTVEATTAQIDQLSYRAGTTAAGVLDELSLHEPDMIWEIVTSGSNPTLVFNYRRRPVDVRYEISTSDGFSQPGGENDLCNRIAVDWVDATKVPPLPQVTVRTTSVPALTAAGIIRDAERISLPDGGGSLTNAQRVGDAVLANLSAPPRAATASVNYRILDMLTGRLVPPYAIRPGYNVRVRETGDVLLMTEMEYDHDSGTASLTLGTPVQTPDQVITRLVKVRR